MMVRFLIALTFLGPLALAKPGKRSDVLELDSGDIVGYQRRPKIFLEFETHSPTMDSIIFTRDDFDQAQRFDVRHRFKIVPPNEVQ
ncbi:MAG: hypothetical protein KDD22_07000 [Bdellovibrionales bacterium]|nr:hypothetical protein [Bdellovibrionales bacterium]